jgi:polyhydroxybutyrate depolymerase
MPWAGGQVAQGMGRGAGGTVLSAPQTVDFWSKIDSCGAARQQPGAGSVVVHDYAGCGLVLYEIRGGGHGWPGGQRGFFAQRFAGAATHDVNATSVIIDFFRRHGM